MSELASHIIAYIDSHNKITGTDTHFTHEINFPAKNTFDSVCVLQASIPKSFYLIAPGYNTFILKEQDQNEVTVFLPIGNYSRKALARTLATELTAASPSQFFNYSVTFPNGVSGPDTGKFTYTITRKDEQEIPPDWVFYFEFGNAYQPCESLGFAINSRNYFTYATLVSANVCRLQARSTIFIKSNCVDNGGTSVLQAIFGSDPDFTVINFQVGNAGGISANRKELVLTNSNSFVFVITDEDGVQLDTNGLSVTFSLLFWDSRRYTLFASK